MGSPDLELEKFVINSVLSATHTSEMDSNDQKDIIKKVKSAGRGDDLDAGDTEPSDEGDSDSEELDLDLNDGGEEEPTEESLVHEGDLEIKSNLEEPALISAKKSSIFAPKGSAEHIPANDINENLDMEQTLEAVEPMVQPQIAPNPTPTPTVKPNEPIEPLRRDKPFLPRRQAQPDPKATK